MTTGDATNVRSRVRSVAEPVARAFGRLGLSPNHLTLIGFGIALLAAGVAAGQLWLLAGVLVLVGGAFDLLDGALARTTGRVSRFGAFMDSVFDRWGEGVIYVGIAWGSAAAGFGAGAVLATAGLASAVMVSYTRAKSEGLGFTSGMGMANIGLAPREVRVVLLAAGLIGLGILGGPLPVWIDCSVVPDGSLADCFGEPVLVFGSGAIVFIASLALIAILATITTIQRILHVVSQTEGDSNS